MRKFALRVGCALLTFAVSGGVSKIERHSRPPMLFGPPEALAATDPVYRCNESPDVPLPILVLLNRQYPGWSFPEVSDDDCYAVRNCGGADAYAQLIKGDFNDDGLVEAIGKRCGGDPAS